MLLSGAFSHKTARKGNMACTIIKRILFFLENIRKELKTRLFLPFSYDIIIWNIIRSAKITDKIRI